ncbi:MAG TPA: ORF6N domain-containing protein [Tepidisphaeraceae bacterium]|jgi:hypothetical protein
MSGETSKTSVRATARRKRPASDALVSAGRIEEQIFLIRGERVMLSGDLAALYGVATRELNQAVKRNRERFPRDFMFQLTRAEAQRSRSQTVTLKRGQNIKYLPYAFTEEGVAMLSAVLRSRRAVAVSIEIMKAFVRLRRMLADHGQLRRKLADLERKLVDHDAKFGMVFQAIEQLLEEPSAEVEKPRIGYETEAAPPPPTEKP